MIVIAQLPPCADADRDRFLRMLPAIREQASVAFRAERPESREDLTAEIIANAYTAFARLVERGKEHVAYATPLAHYAIRQVRAGRRIGSRLNVQDVTSPHAKLRKRLTVERLDQFDRETGEWKEVLVEDRHAGPAETAASRIDLAAWYRSLGRQKRRIARLLSRGESTSNAARITGLSTGRISQVRRELAESWGVFQGESAAA